VILRTSGGLAEIHGEYFPPTNPNGLGTFIPENPSLISQLPPQGTKATITPREQNKWSVTMFGSITISYTSKITTATTSTMTVSFFPNPNPPTSGNYWN